MSNKYLDKAKKILMNLWIPLVVVGVILIVDVITKQLVLNKMSFNDSIEIIPKFFHITSIRNTGMAFGLLSGGGARWAFIALTAVAVPGVTYLMIRWQEGHMLLKVSLAMIIAGGLGNFVDRCPWGAVVDFIEIKYFGGVLFGSEAFPIFNIADVALVVGTICLLVYLIFFFVDKKDLAEVAKFEKKKKAKELKKAAKLDEKMACDVESVEQFLERTGQTSDEGDDVDGEKSQESDVLVESTVILAGENS